VAFALTYGVVGSYLMRAQFHGIGTWTDALYFTFVTYSTLGYGDILPVTQDAKLFATSMVPIGLVSFITALSALLAPAVERRVKGVFTIMERFQPRGGHVIVCGYSSVTESVIDELRARGITYMVVDPRQDLVLHLRNRGHDVLAGDPARRETLEQADVRDASAVISGFDQDSINILVALTGREIRESSKGAEFRILVRVEDEENIEKARRAGADEVISPSTEAGRALASRAVAKGDGG
jgi:voltage-gated potassium channel